MHDGKPISLWDASAQEREPDSVSLPIEPVDVAIVGGGFTGLSTALHCAEAGLDALVIEAHHVGYGGSGRNVGLVNAGIWLPPAQVRTKMGGTYGPRFLDKFSKAPAQVFDLIEKHQIRCEVTRTGTIHAGHAASGMRDLEGRWREWDAMGEPVELLDRARVSELIGTEAFVGGLLDHRAGTINPMGYCRGLARAAIGAGARIATGVQVTGLQKMDAGWRVETDQGEVRAKSVVLGTNAYTDTLWPGLSQTFTIIHYLQFATKPMGDRLDGILPGRQGVWTTAPVMSSFRRDASERLMVGTMGRVFGTHESGLSKRWAERELARVFPQLGPVEFEEAWHGQIAMTPDHLPRIHILDEGLFTPIAYNGRGITSGTVFGQAMAGLLTGQDPMDLPMQVTDPAKVPARDLKSRFYDVAFAANQFIKGF